MIISRPVIEKIKRPGILDAVSRTTSNKHSEERKKSKSKSKVDGIHRRKIKHEKRVWLDAEEGKDL